MLKAKEQTKIILELKIITYKYKLNAILNTIVRRIRARNTRFESTNIIFKIGIRDKVN